MDDSLQKFEVTDKIIKKDKWMKLAAWSLPPVLGLIPSSILFVLMFLFGTTPPVAFTFFFFAIVALIGGTVLGVGASAGTLIYRSRWLAQLREKIALDGIKASEVDWFINELKGEEKRGLKEIKSKNLLLADAYKETLASRLTATRIIKSTKKELMLAKRRKNKLKYLKSERVEEFKAEVAEDIENLKKIKNDADEMRIEAESRLQMIEAASRRGTELAGNELALKKLTARSEQLPIALEAAKMEDELRKEFVDVLEKEFEDKDEGQKLIKE